MNLVELRWPPGPITQARVEEALLRVQAAALSYRSSAYPKPFGQLQTAIRDARFVGASCQALRVVLGAIEDEEEGTR